MLRVLISLFALTLFASPAESDEASANVHLYAGVRAFRAQSYDVALAEFRQVERAGGTSDLALYLGPTLYKLGHFDEARLVLARMHRTSQPDAVADYYLGLTYYRLGFLRLARAVFAALDRNEAGPKLAEGAARFVIEIDRLKTASVDVPRLLTSAESLEREQPIAALDAAEEAFLRAPPGAPERVRAAALVTRLSTSVGQVLPDPAIRQAADEIVRRAQP